MHALCAIVCRHNLSLHASIATALLWQLLLPLLLLLLFDIPGKIPCKQLLFGMLGDAIAAATTAAAINTKPQVKYLLG